MKRSLLLFVALITVSLNLNAKNPVQPILEQDTLLKAKNYIIFSKTDNISKVSIDQNLKKKKESIFIRLAYPTPAPNSNAVAGVVQSSKPINSDDIVGPVIDNIQILSGKYEDIKVDKESNYKNLYTLTGLVFPLKLSLKTGNDTVVFEIKEAGYWNIGIDLKK